MRSAPAVSYPVGRSRFQLALVLALSILGAAVTGVWMASIDTPAVRQAITVPIWLVLSAVALWRWHQAPQTSLHWDQQHWRCAASDDGVPCVPTVCLDLQRLMLVCLHTPGAGTRWLVLERTRQAHAWHALRCALFTPT